MIRILSYPLAVFLATPALAGAADTGFLDRVFKGDDGTESKYVIFVPHDYAEDGDKKYPVILFLHGAGETGDDGVKQAKVGLGPAIRKREKEFPFIAVFPQASHTRTPVRQRWYAERPDGKDALAILAEVMGEYRTDPKRLYLSGLSMGGFGTWNMAAAMPDKWAAIVPVCGAGDPADGEKLKSVPCWAFHGDEDRAVPVDGSRRMIDAIRKAGGEPKYTEYEGVGHNSWDRAYGTAELYDWLLKHSKE